MDLAISVQELTVSPSFSLCPQRKRWWLPCRPFSTAMQGSKAGCCTAAKQGPDAWCSAPATKGSEGGRAGLCASALGFEVGLRTGDGGVRGGVHLGAGVLSISDVSASSVFCMRFVPTSIYIDMQEDQRYTSTNCRSLFSIGPIEYYPRRDNYICKCWLCTRRKLDIGYT